MFLNKWLNLRKIVQITRIQSLLTLF